MSLSNNSNILKICNSFDWALNGYFLFVVGSILYFIQALAPFIHYPIDGRVDSSAIDAHYQNVTLAVTTQEYYPLYDNRIDAWVGILACILFDLESVMYIWGWILSR